MKDIKSKNLKEQVCFPFYLMQLSNLFKSTGSLPEIDKLMGKLISASFDQDKNKYVNTKDIISCKREARENLEILAFAMQCMRKTALSSEEYQELINKDEREIIKYYGIWKQTGKDQWEFEHNNFREYLTAEYIKGISLHDVIDLVTYKENRARVKASWMNVLSFAVMSYPRRELFDWIVKTEPSLVVQFESSRLSERKFSRALSGVLLKKWYGRCFGAGRYDIERLWISGMDQKKSLGLCLWNKRL